MRTRPVPTPQLWTREGHEEPRRRDVEGTRRSRSRRGPPRDATRESPGRPGDGAHTRHTQGRARRLRKSYGKTTDRPPRRTRGNQGSRTGRRARAVEPPGSCESEAISARPEGRKVLRIRPHRPDPSSGLLPPFGSRYGRERGWFRGMNSPPQAYPPIPAGPRTREKEDTDRSGCSKFLRSWPLQGGSRPAPRRWPR